MPTPDHEIFEKDFTEDDLKGVPNNEEVLLPLSVLEGMIDKMNLDMRVRFDALHFAVQMPYGVNSDATQLVANAKKIESYLIEAASNPLTHS